MEELKPLPDDLPFERYSALMGLLATNGGKLINGPNWYWYPRTIVLKLSHTNLDFLHWLMDTFSPSFTFVNEPQRVNKVSQSYRVNSVATELNILLYVHWNETTLANVPQVLPYHFAKYFSWHTLAFWAMRNGKRMPGYYMIHVGMLTEVDKKVLMSAIKDKCGLDSRLVMNQTKLAISNPEVVVSNLQPLFHESQLHRLTK